jgi:hypothetical protein
MSLRALLSEAISLQARQEIASAQNASQRQTSDEFSFRHYLSQLKICGLLLFWFRLAGYGYRKEFFLILSATEGSKFQAIKPKIA